MLLKLYQGSGGGGGNNKQMKKCNTCKKEFPATLKYFYSDKSRPDTLHYNCKKCKDEINTNYRKKHPKRRKLYSYKHRAKKKSLTWTIDKTLFNSLVSGRCKYCNGIGGGIDRIDSNKGYDPENVVACCWDCNNSKGHMGYKEWINHLKKIIKHCED